jgi:hypothetical protein
MGLNHSGQDPVWRLHNNAVSPYLLLLSHKLIRVMPALSRIPQNRVVTNKMRHKGFPFLYLWPGLNCLSEIRKTGIFQGLKGEMPTAGMHGYCPKLRVYCQNSAFIKNKGAFL